MPTWPITLPLYVQEGGYQEKPGSTTLETGMDIGPAKIRRRFTRTIRQFSVSMMMTPAQVATFETFYESDCLSGSISFTWVHPRTRAVATVRFRNPRYTIGVQGGGGSCMVQFTIEII